MTIKIYFYYQQNIFYILSMLWLPRSGGPENTQCLKWVNKQLHMREYCGDSSRPIWPTQFLSDKIYYRCPIRFCRVIFLNSIDAIFVVDVMYFVKYMMSFPLVFRTRNVEHLHWTVIEHRNCRNMMRPCDFLYLRIGVMKENKSFLEY